MRGMKLLLAVALLVTVRAQAAVYGDFIVPSGLSSSPQGAAITNRTAVSVPLEGGGAMTVYFSLVPEYTDTPLRSIAAGLGNASNAVAMSLGGRPWFGVQRTVIGMGNYFEGFTHRNGMVYGVDVDLGSRARPDAAVRQAFDRIWLFPGLTGMAAGTVAGAVDRLDSGDATNVLAVLNAAPPQDTGNWAAMLLRAMAQEMTGDLDAAAASYASAAAMVQGAAELNARAAGAAALAGTSPDAQSGLVSLAAAAPEEPVVWEELGKVALAGGDLTAAQGYFNQAALVNPADETALYNLAFIHAQNGDYAGALRRGRELLHYFPWVPNGAIPDVTSAPGMDESRINMIMAEPLPLGNLGAYGAISAQPLDYSEAQQIVEVIQVPATVQATVPVYQPTYGPDYSYVPIVLFDWLWNISGHRPWWGSGHRPRPPGSWHPGGPGIRPPRPPGMRPPHFPERPGQGGNRPPRPPEGWRPPEGGGRPPEGWRPPEGGGRPPEGGGTRPPGGGGRPPEGGRPPSGITTLPAPYPGITTLPAPVTPTPPATVYPSEPSTRPSVVRPTTRPAGPVTRPTSRPAPETSVRPARPAPGFTQPGRPEARPMPAPRPSLDRRPMARPSPAGPGGSGPDRSMLRR